MSDENSLKLLKTFGQSFWMDYIRHDLIVSGELRRMIVEDGLRGITSNPAIFEQAIVESTEYDSDIRFMALEGASSLSIYETISRRDVQMAAGEFRALYEMSNGQDGYVSIEINPHLAHDTKGTINEARRLWSAINRPNVFIKIPATLEGLPAIQQLISDGININATLIFGLPRYRQVAEAYIAGIAARLATGKNVSHVASVASFFVSRLDTIADPLLSSNFPLGSSKGFAARQAHGQVAVASARLAYRMFKEIFIEDGFKAFGVQGARVQRLLWASTGTKNPEYSDVKYVESLVGLHTINTMPLPTINAYRDHGNPELRLEQDVQIAAGIIGSLDALGINIDDLTQQLENQGVDSFTDCYDRMMQALSKYSTAGVQGDFPQGGVTQ